MSPPAYIEMVNVDLSAAGKRDSAPQVPGVSGAAEAFSRQDFEGYFDKLATPW
jgi:hypothetical protein